MPSPVSRHALLAYNDEVLAQAAQLAGDYQCASPAVFSHGAGPHLRHVIEHFDALLCPVEPGVVDYDDRPRDRRLERDAALAMTRLQELQNRLHTWEALRLHDAVQVRGLAGAAGQWPFAVTSTLARELAFVASHAVHHFALLRTRCEAQGLTLPADFGIAPATVAHARALSSERALLQSF